MPQTLKIANFSSLNIVEESRLAQDVSIADTTIYLQSSQNFAVDSHVYLGRRASETGELVIPNAISNETTIVVASPGAVFDHSKFDDVTVLFGDRIKIYRAANVDGSQPADASFAVLAGGTVDIDLDQASTEFIDAAGDSDYWYKFTYYSSSTAEETDLADSLAVRGGDVGNYASIESIRREAGLLTNRWISDAQIDEKRQAAQTLINSTLSGIYTLPFSRPINATIAEITRLLAAGYLLTDNYGPLNTLNTNEGQQKIDRVTNKDKTGILDRLNTKDLVLLDETGTDTSIEGTGNSFSGWPDDTTATEVAESGGAERKFRMSDEF